jgi:hypothetical protein
LNLRHEKCSADYAVLPETFMERRAGFGTTEGKIP